MYHELLDERFIKPVVHEDFFDVYHIFNIRHKKRDKLREYLLQHQIKTEVHYPIPPHKQKAMQGIFTGEYPLSDEIHETTLSLPISYYHTQEDIQEVCQWYQCFPRS